MISCKAIRSGARLEEAGSQYSTFGYVALPIVIVTIVNVEGPPDNTEQSKPKCVLVADDEPEILMLMSTILSANGYSVIEATSGMAALEASRGRECDIRLLITDVVMPDLNGPHLAEELLSRIPNLRVLFVSGWEPRVIAHEGAFRRGFRTLAKPFSAAGLLDAVQMVLEEPPRLEMGHRAERG